MSEGNEKARIKEFGPDLIDSVTSKLNGKKTYIPADENPISLQATCAAALFQKSAQTPPHSLS